PDHRSEQSAGDIRRRKRAQGPSRVFPVSLGRDQRGAGRAVTRHGAQHYPQSYQHIYVRRETHAAYDYRHAKARSQKHGFSPVFVGGMTPNRREDGRDYEGNAESESRELRDQSRVVDSEMLYVKRQYRRDLAHSHIRYKNPEPANDQVPFPNRHEREPSYPFILGHVSTRRSMISPAANSVFCSSLSSRAMACASHVHFSSLATFRTTAPLAVSLMII